MGASCAGGHVSAATEEELVENTAVNRAGASKINGEDGALPSLLVGERLREKDTTEVANEKATGGRPAGGGPAQAPASRPADAELAAFERHVDAARWLAAAAVRLAPREPCRAPALQVKQLVSESLEVKRCQMQSILGEVGGPLASPEWFQMRGFEDVSGGNKDGVTTWLKAKSHIHAVTVDIPELPFSAASILPLMLEMDEVSSWFPFCHKSEVLHEFTGAMKMVRLVRVVIKVLGICFESIFLVYYEDLLEERGCLVMHIFSPPVEEEVHTPEGVMWHGARIPPKTRSFLYFLIPVDCARIAITPVPGGKLKFRGEASTPVGAPAYVLRFFYRELSKRVVGIVKHVIATVGTNGVGEAARRNSKVHRFWGDKLASHLQGRL